MVAQPCRGRAWCGCPKPKRRSWLRKQSAQALLWRLESTGLTGRPHLEGFPVSDTFLLLVKLWSEALGIKCDDRRAAFARRSDLTLAFLISATGVRLLHCLPQRRAWSVEETLHPVTLPACVVVFAHLLGLELDRRSYLGITGSDFHVTPFITSL